MNNIFESNPIETIDKHVIRFQNNISDTIRKEFYTGTRKDLFISKFIGKFKDPYCTASRIIEKVFYKDIIDTQEEDDEDELDVMRELDKKFLKEPNNSFVNMDGFIVVVPVNIEHYEEMTIHDGEPITVSTKRKGAVEKLMDDFKEKNATGEEFESVKLIKKLREEMDNPSREIIRKSNMVFSNRYKLVFGSLLRKEINYFYYLIHEAVIKSQEKNKEFKKIFYKLPSFEEAFLSDKEFNTMHMEITVEKRYKKE